MGEGFKELSPLSLLVPESLRASSSLSLWAELSWGLGGILCGPRLRALSQLSPVGGGPRPGTASPSLTSPELQAHTHRQAS